MRKLVAAAVLALAAAYLVLLLRNTCFFASGPDSTGYLNEAKLFAAGKLTVQVTPLRELGLPREFIDVFVPLGFLPGTGSVMVPTYAPGLPLHMLLFAAIGGWSIAPFLVPPLAAIGSLVLLYAFARECGLSRGWSLLAPATLAPAAPFLALATQPMSDVPATFWVLLALWCALASARNPRFAIFSGFALAVAVSVRPTNALAIVPLAIALPLTPRTCRNVVLGGLVPGIALLWLNHAQYGSPFRFGFASAGDVLTWSLPPVCGAFHLEWTIRTLTPVALVLALLVFVVGGVAPRLRLMFGAWFVVFFAFYAFYGYCPAWSAVRFLLPAFPAVIVAALFALRESTGRLRNERLAIAIVTLCMLLTLAGIVDRTSKFRVFRVDDDQSVFPEVVQWARTSVPGNAMLVSGVFSGAFYVDTRWTVRWDRLDADRFMLLRAYAGNANRPWYAVLQDTEVTRDEFLKRLPGRWTAIGRKRDVTLYRLDS